ncbi:MAG: sugar porter family MFS transporter [Acidobacteria bacterium]|nr:sugar porter family MFS transporter [Acidobacteriota bacterium]
MHGAIVNDNVAPISVPADKLRYIFGISLAAALGGLLFGYDFVVIGGARQFYEVYFHLTSASVIGWANSCALLGCLIGSIAAGYFADRFGRRKLLLLAAVLFAVSSAATGWAFSFTAFIVWRIVGGIAIGISSNVSPLYIAEISPASIRGRLVSLNQLAIVIGILLAQIVNWRIARPEAANISADALFHSWNVQYGWRWMFTAIVVPSALFIIASILLPESPRWLLNRKRDAAARKTLENIGGEAYAEAEMASIHATLLAESKNTATMRDLFAPRYRGVLALGIALAVLQQWTGINVLFNYAAEVYKSAGYGANDVLLNIVITGSINLIFTLLAFALVDSLGRRKLMVLGCAGIGISHLLCAFAYHQHYRGIAVLVLTLSAIACFALTLAPVVWVLISEIFPNRIRAHGVSAAVSALWIACFLLTYTFPLLNSALGTGGTFVIYGLISFLGLVIVLLFVKETKGQTLEEIGEAA